MSVKWEINTAKSIAKRTLETLTEDTAHLGELTAEGALARGRTFARAGYLNEAADSFKQALKDDDTKNEASARLVLVLIRMGSNKEALSVAMRLAARAPTYSMREATSDEKINAFTLLGDALSVNERAADAIQAYETARRTDAADTTAAGRLAQHYLAAGEPKKALAQANVFANNERFHELSQLLTLGARNEALLPSYRGVSPASFVMDVPTGRPLSVDGEARLAEVAGEGDEWCGDVAELLKNAPAR